MEWPFFHVRFPVSLVTLKIKEGERHVDEHFWRAMSLLIEDAVRYPQEKLHAYVFLPNHLHLLLEHKTPKEFLKYLMNETKMFFENLWGKNFEIKTIMNLEDFRRAFFFIHQEPLWAGFVRHPIDYLSSSYVSYAKTFGLRFERFFTAVKRRYVVPPRSWENSCVFSSVVF